jgi:hypothetical protein
MIKQFEITSGKLVCSDPCYSIPTWCQGIVENVKNGIWGAEINLSDEGDWGTRVASLFICNEDSFDKDNSIVKKIFEDEPLNFSAGVDSGQFGFFDFEHYRNNDSAKDLKKYDFGGGEKAGDEWYGACCHLTLGQEKWGVLPNGVVSSSGFGDGAYDVFGLKNDEGEYVAFAVVFIYDEDEDDEDWLSGELDDEEDDYALCDNCKKKVYDCDCRGETTEGK